MNESERALVRLSAAVAARDGDRLRRAMDEATARSSVVEIEEALLQSYLFLGYPVTLEAMSIWRERAGPSVPAGVSPSRSAAGVDRPVSVPGSEGVSPSQRSGSEDPAVWPGRGERVCEQVYGDQYARLRESVGRLHPDLERWMVVEGYGKVLGRPGLTLRVRELCIVAILVVLHARRQLYAHLRGALNAGAAPEEVEEALRLAVAYTAGASADAAFETWGELMARRGR